VVVSGGEDGTVRVWDLETGASCGEPLRGHDGLVNAVAVGAVGGRHVVVSGGEDGTVRVWDLETGASRGEPLRGHDFGVLAVAVGVVGGRPVVVSGSSDCTVRLWSASGRHEHTILLDSIVSSLALAPRSRIVAATFKGLLALQLDPAAKEPGAPPPG
jgi:WD40 repeat protein